MAKGEIEGLKPGHFSEPILSVIATVLTTSAISVLYLSKEFIFRHTHVNPNSLPEWMDHEETARGIAAAVMAGLAAIVWRLVGKQRYAKELASGDKLAIFVARFDEGKDEAVRDRVIASLKETLGDAVQIGRANFVLRADERVSDVSEETKGAEKKAQEFLKRTGGHLLIWGKADSLGDIHVVDLHFVSPAHDGSEGRQYGYMPGKLRLGTDFGREIGTALAAVAASLAGAALSRKGSYLADVLKPLARQLELLIRSLPSVLTREDRRILLSSYASVQSMIGQQTGESSRLEKAVDAYKMALDELSRDSDPLRWAATQNDLGIALQALGERVGSTMHLENAIRAFKLALEEREPERDPLDWATTQNNLGFALQTLGERESGAARLEEAVAAYQLALRERTRTRAPLDWAETQNNLGAALKSLGERESGTARLEEAVAAYRLALEERTRERVPLDWAATQNNLGAVLQSLGERQGGAARLEEAVAAYRLALAERTRERVPLEWAMTQNNLGNALSRLGERESGTNRLEEAVTAYRLALEVRTRELVPLQWATTQNNLGNALSRLGERENGTARLEEAVAAYRLALEELNSDTNSAAMGCDGE